MKGVIIFLTMLLVNTFILAEEPKPVSDTGNIVTEPWNISKNFELEKTVVQHQKRPQNLWKPVTFTVNYEFFEVGNAFDFYESELNKLGHMRISAEDSILGAKLSVGPGSGIQVSAIFPLNNKGLKHGWSMDYIVGPSADIDIINRQSSLSQETYKANINTGFVRLMNNFEMQVRLTPGVNLTLGAGAGFANGFMRKSYTQSWRDASLSVNDDSRTFSDNVTDDWLAITAEVSPSLNINLDGFAMRLSAVYVWFPDVWVPEKTTQSLPLKWNPFGLRLGLEF